MRTVLTVYPVRRVHVPRLPRKRSGDGFGKLLGKLDAASERLQKSRRRR